jgi:hypothetical protein
VPISVPSCWLCNLCFLLFKSFVGAAEGFCGFVVPAFGWQAARRFVLVGCILVFYFFQTEARLARIAVFLDVYAGF